MLLYCRKCGKKMPSELEVCGHCGSTRYDGPDELLTHKLPPAPGKSASRPTAAVEDGKKGKGSLAGLFASKKPAAVPSGADKPSPLAALFQRKDKAAAVPTQPALAASVADASPAPSGLAALFARKGKVADESAVQPPVVQARGGILSGKAEAVRPERASVLAPAAPDKAILQPARGADLLGRVSSLLRFAQSGKEKKEGHAVSRDIAPAPTLKERLLSLLRKGK